MSGPSIRITIQLGMWPQREDKEIVLPLDEYLVRRCVTPLDLPRAGTDALTAAVFCSPPDLVQDIGAHRDALASTAAAAVRAAMREALGGRDTENGYRRR